MRQQKDQTDLTHRVKISTYISIMITVVAKYYIIPTEIGRSVDFLELQFLIAQK